MEFQSEKNRIFWKDGEGKLLAEVTFPGCGEGVVEIDHTFVDGSLRGQGVASELMLAAAEYLRGQGKKVRPVCSYAVRWFQNHPDYGDLLS